jgi:PPK2 family polyphosphate:nucleotide phosphotransferase
MNRKSSSKKQDVWIRQFLVAPDTRVRLKDYDPGWTGGEMHQLKEDELRAHAREYLKQTVDELSKTQERLYASDVYAVLVVFQAMDAAGKDSTIKHVMSGINPQGCQVFSFKQPSAEDLDHDFMWRYAKSLPERGRIGIFNRSYYEEVLVVRVHPEVLAREKLPEGKRDRGFWEDRYQDINAFERYLTRNGTLIVKFFLNVSKAEQKRRFLARLDEPEKNWKFSAADVQERRYWRDYMAAYEDMLTATSRRWAPWYIVPADHKHVTHAVVATILAQRIAELGVTLPKLSKEQKAALEQARQALLAEKD